MELVFVDEGLSLDGRVRSLGGWIFWDQNHMLRLPVQVYYVGTVYFDLVLVDSVGPSALPGYLHINGKGVSHFCMRWSVFSYFSFKFRRRIITPTSKGA